MTFLVRSEIVVIGTNPEMADMDNPKGEIYGESFRAMVTLPNGERFLHFLAVVYTMGGTKISKGIDLVGLREFVQKLQNEKPALNPQYWEKIEPCYGSQAWQEYERQ